MVRRVSAPPKVSKPRIGEFPSLLAKIVGIKCPECNRPQSPKKMALTNPYRGHNRTDFHMCGGCGSLLYLTGERRNRRTFLLTFPTFLIVSHLGFALFRRIDGLNVYREAREAYEPNFLGFLLTCAAIYVCLGLQARFEIVGIATVPDLKNKEPASNS